jgi:glycosyltransferase involved in cell wall biosynthesis
MVSAAIDSALNQGVHGMEVIVVDDNSDDETAAVLARFGERIRTLRLPRSEGVAHARNQAVALARGRWLAFLDSDDLWLPGKIDAQILEMEKDDSIALCFCDYAVDEETTQGEWQETMICGRRPGSRDFAALFRRNFIGTLTVMLRRDCFQAVGGFDESLHRGSDYDLWLRVAATYPIKRVSGVYARYRRHAGSLTGLDTRRDGQTWADVTRRWVARDPQVLTRVGWSYSDWRDSTTLLREA